MRTIRIAATTTLLLAVAGAFAMAGAKEVHTRVDDFSCTNDDGTSLALHSENDSGVIVTRAEPAPLHGLQRGDVILAVDGKPVHQVEGITRALRGRTTPVALRVRRGTSESTVVWSRADYRMFTPAPPPPSPAPPAPPK